MNQVQTNDASPLQATVDQVARDLHSKIDQAGAALGDIGEQALTGTREVLDRVRTAVSTRAKGAGTQTDDYVRNHPWACIGAGALAGVMLGVVLARR